MHELALIVGLVTAVLLVTWAAGRLRLSAPLTLLVVGVLASYLPFVHIPELDPELVLFGFLPPLLYAAAVNTSLVDFRTHFPAIGWLSIGLVLFTAAGVGLVVVGLLPIPFAAAFALGAIVAPPDAVAATAVARETGLPRRVVTILEGESLVNDATALVSLRTAVAALGATVTVVGAVTDFLWAAIIGVLAGVVVAKLSTLLFKLLTDAVSSTALTFLIPFAAYALAEAVHASGVLAVVTAGLLIGHVTPVVRSASARLSTWVNWSTVQWVLEHTVFLLIGLQAHSILDAAAAHPVSNGQIALTAGAVLLAVIVLRMIYVLAARPFLGTRHRLLPWREAAIISWAGMRGVVTLAAALTLAIDTPMRPVLVLIALVVTAGTLLLQGLSLPWVARRMRVRGPDPREDALQAVMAAQRAARAGLEEVERIAGEEDAELVAELKAQSKRRMGQMWERLGHTPGVDLGTESRQMTYRRLRLAALDAERRTVLQLRDKGFADHEVLQSLLTEMDLEETSLENRDVRERELREAAPAGSEGAAPCVHLGEAAATVDFEAHGECLDCVASGEDPVELRMCLTCGHIACCDSSPGQHAARHFRQSGHPVMRSIEPGEHWRWCYLDNLHDAGDSDD